METQKTVFSFLNEIKTQLQKSEVKSLTKIKEKYKLNPQVLTTIFEMGIVSKNRPYEWNDDFKADENTALMVEQQSKLYQPVISSYHDIINIPEIETGFKIDFRKVWPCLGFSRQDNAKSSLLRYFKKGIDFEVLTCQEVGNEIPGLSEDYDQRAEIIMLNLPCTLDFLTIVDKPMAKLFIRKMNKFLIERSKKGEIPAMKLETISITFKMMEDAQDVELLARNYKTMLSDDGYAKGKNPTQMELPYVDELVYDRRRLLLTQITEILTRQYNQKQPNYDKNVQNKLAIEGHGEGEKNGRSSKISENGQLEPNKAPYIEA